jgi:hypothetical protein
LKTFSKNPIYIAPYFNGPFQIGGWSIWNIFLLYMGIKHFHWLYFILLIFSLIIPFVQQVKIYENKIERKRTIFIYSWYKVFLLNQSYLFKYEGGGRSSDLYGFRFKNEEGFSKVSFYIIKKLQCRKCSNSVNHIK